jgi:hypothetical protein
MVARRGILHPRRIAFWMQLSLLFGLMLGLLAGAQWAMHADDGIAAKSPSEKG